MGNNHEFKYYQETGNYIKSQIESGDFNSASEVVTAALRLHETYRDRVIQRLQEEITKGWSGKMSKRKAADIVRDNLWFVEN